MTALSVPLQAAIKKTTAAKLSSSVLVALAGFLERLQADIQIGAFSWNGNTPIPV